MCYFHPIWECDHDGFFRELWPAEFIEGGAVVHGDEVVSEEFFEPEVLCEEMDGIVKGIFSSVDVLCFYHCRCVVSFVFGGYFFCW